MWFLLFLVTFRLEAGQHCARKASEEVLVHTERTLLQKFGQKHMTEEIKILSNSKVMAMEGVIIEDPKLHALEMVLASSYSSDFFAAAVLDKKTKRYLGTLTAIRNKNQQVSLSYHFHPDFWGEGIATESIEAFIKFLSETSEIKSIVAHTAPANLASRQVLEKLGFAEYFNEPEKPYFVRYRRKL